MSEISVLQCQADIPVNEINSQEDCLSNTTGGNADKSDSELSISSEDKKAGGIEHGELIKETMNDSKEDDSTARMNSEKKEEVTPSDKSIEEQKLTPPRSKVIPIKPMPQKPKLEIVNINLLNKFPLFQKERNFNLNRAHKILNNFERNIQNEALPNQGPISQQRPHFQVGRFPETSGYHNSQRGQTIAHDMYGVKEVHTNINQYHPSQSSSMAHSTTKLRTVPPPYHHQPTASVNNRNYNVYQQHEQLYPSSTNFNKGEAYTPEHSYQSNNMSNQEYRNIHQHYSPVSPSPPGYVNVPSPVSPDSAIESGWIAEEHKNRFILTTNRNALSLNPYNTNRSSVASGPQHVSTISLQFQHTPPQHISSQALLPPPSQRPYNTYHDCNRNHAHHNNNDVRHYYNYVELSNRSVGYPQEHHCNLQSYKAPPLVQQPNASSNRLFQIQMNHQTNSDERNNHPYQNTTHPSSNMMNYSMNQDEEEYYHHQQEISYSNKGEQMTNHHDYKQYFGKLGKQKSFTCYRCRKGFSRKDGLFRHLASVKCEEKLAKKLLTLRKDDTILIK